MLDILDFVIHILFISISKQRGFYFIFYFNMLTIFMGAINSQIWKDFLPFFNLLTRYYLSIAKTDKK